MTELYSTSTDAVTGGNIFLQVIAVGKFLYEGAEAYGKGISGLGGTLSNYYGPEAALDIIAAGNMGA